jgi:hypothetical protein
MTPDLIALSVGTAGVIIMGLCVIAGARKGALREANAERQPEPECVGTMCAWCSPGIDHPGGHGICPIHAEQMRAELRAMKCERTEGEAK